MEIQELRRVKTPFKVVSVHDGHTATVTGFQLDPLGVGAGCAYFTGGGWLLISDLLKHFKLTPRRKAGTNSNLTLIARP